MRPLADILADTITDPPASLDVAEWEAYCDAVSAAEVADLGLHNWLALACELRGHGPLEIPADIARDPRLDSGERFVLAALLEVGRDVDTTRSDAYPALSARLFGSFADLYDEAALRGALARLCAHGALSPTTSGGWIRRTT